jgi:ribose transport system ATP-binding protein
MPVLLQMRGLRKSYGAVRALDWTEDTAIAVEPGMILGLAGENGAGKSTLLGSLAGSIKLDSGEFRLDGAAYDPVGPFDALSKGVALIPQETLLLSTLTVAENVLLGREKEYSTRGFINTRRRDRLAREALALIRADINPRAMCQSLPLEHKKMIELARALAARPRVLLVDETSTALSGDGARILFSCMDHVAEDGAVIFVTYRPDEIIRYCSDVAILKDGAIVGTRPTARTDANQITAAIVGRAFDGGLNNEIRNVDHTRTNGSVVLSADRLVAPGCTEFSLELRAGEIVGIWGLVGCGADTLARTLAGATKQVSGAIRVGNRDVTRLGLRGRLHAGIGYIPKDRDEEGLLLGASIMANIALGSLDHYGRLGFLMPYDGLEDACRQITNLSIKAGGPHTLVQNLSGGNRQKVLLGRWLQRDVTVLILNNPTRGVDVETKDDIYRLLDCARANGKAMIVICDELPELLRLSDRVLTMRHGSVSAEYRWPLPTEHELLEAML